VPRAADRCPRCGADFRALHERDCTEKLIGALNHPDRETVMGVAGILGARDDERATPALVDALRRLWRDPYVAAAIVEALGHLSAPTARQAVHDALDHESVIVRAKAALVLQEQAPRSLAVGEDPRGR
jgi:HEAT repeat protein